jgi:hypothetical protein
MARKIHREQGLLPIFADLHLEEKGANALHLELTFAVDVAIEKLAAAFYMDGSDSMKQAGNYGRGGGWFQLNIGLQRNPVREAMRVIVPYIASKDSSGACRVAYWASGKAGRDIEAIGELTAQDADAFDYAGPKVFGQGTFAVPALRDFVAYINGLQKGGELVKVAYCIVVTDGQLHDYFEAAEYTKEIAKAIMAGKFPRTNLMLVGVGPAVDHEQMEKLSEMKVDGYVGRDIWCCAEADVVDDLPELIAHLLDENTPAFWGGATINDEHGRTLLAFEDMVPAVIEFEVSKNAQKFFITASGQKFEQTLIFPEHDE